MQYLFRAYSSSSQGINTTSLIAPEAAKQLADPTEYEAPTLPAAIMKDRLQESLAWKKTEDNTIFVFFTSSLLFAVQMALFRRSAGELDISIIAMPTETARTSNCKPVQFHSVTSMSESIGAIRRKNKDGSSKTYRDVYIAMDCIVPGKDVRAARLKDMIEAGLYQLYPPLQSSECRRKARLNLAVVDLRQYWFQTENDLTMGQITVAAEITSAFETKKGGSPKVSSDILAHLLAFQQRNIANPALSEWLSRFSNDTIDIDDDDDNGFVQPAFDSTGIPELQQYHNLSKILGARQIRNSGIEAMAIIETAVVGQESARWQQWRTANREKMRASRPERDSAGRDDRNQQSPKRNHTSEEDRSGDRRYRDFSRTGRARLPRVEYQTALQMRNEDRAARGLKRFRAGGEREWRAARGRKEKRMRVER